jgi:hypothetical protein
MIYLEAENLSEVVDAKSSLEAGDGTTGGSVEVSVDSVQVNALGNHGDSLTNDLDDVVKAKGISSLSTNTVNKADELGSQGGGVRKSTLDLENKMFSFVYHGMKVVCQSVFTVWTMGPSRETSWVSRATTSTTTPWVIPPSRLPTSPTRERRWEARGAVSPVPTMVARKTAASPKRILAVLEVRKVLKE